MTIGETRMKEATKNKRASKVIIEEQYERCLSLLNVKGNEYSHDDTLYFKRAGELQGIEPEQALYGMLAKHLVSLADLCKDPSKGTKDKWLEKLTDATNYLFLLRVLIDERDLK